MTSTLLPPRILADVGGSPHFMIKEIHEEPAVLKKIWDSSLETILSASEILSRARRIYTVGSGSSYNAGLLLHHLLSRRGLLSIPTVSGEFRFYSRLVGEGDVVVAISQSGRTRDTLEAARRSAELGAKVVGITNDHESPLAKLSSRVLSLMAGREEAVTATKTFMAQVYVSMILASGLDGGGELLRELRELPRRLSAAIASLEPVARRIAVEFYRSQNVYVAGEGPGYAVAREAALKFKEAVNMHAEALQASEIRHGPKSIVSKAFPVFTNIFEGGDEASVRPLVEDLAGSRASIYIVASEGIGRELAEKARIFVEVPGPGEAGAVAFSTAFYQLVSYYSAVMRLLDPDAPRFLSKVVL